MNSLSQIFSNDKKPEFLIQGSKINISKSKKAEIILDSDDRFSEDAETCSFWKLPHDENGFNKLDGEVIDDFLYYQGNFVVKISDLEKYAKKHHHINNITLLPQEKGTDDSGIFYDSYTVYVTNIIEVPKIKDIPIMNSKTHDDENFNWLRAEPIMFGPIPIINSWITVNVYY